jgi:hypothetical protein
VSEITCELLAGSIQNHLQQLYTGFLMLHRRGRVDARQRIIRDHAPRAGPQHLRTARDYHLRVVVNRRIALYYDVHDSWEVDEQDVQHVDFYFKRSYDPARLSSLPAALRGKIHPLGLNYSLFPDGVDWFGLVRNLRLARGARKLSEAARALGVSDPFAFTPRVGVMWSPPDDRAIPRALFMTRAFDPNDQTDRSQAKKDEREWLNDERAQLIRVLRRELGERFYGGFTHTPHATRRYPDLLVGDAARGTKAGYIAQLRSYSIGIATTGIHESIGWKFAEYVAFAKAIVSEPLHYRVTGDLAPGRNYLEFRSIDECVQHVVRLLEDADLRRAMMASNAAYYQSYLRPDVLVMNSLASVVGS